MSEQVHKRLTDEQVRMILGRYAVKELTAAQAIELLGLKRRQFFEWTQRYRKDPDGFTVQYQRKEKNRKLGDAVDRHIVEELAIEKRLIDDPALPVRFYNYSYIQDQMRKNYQEKVSLYCRQVVPYHQPRRLQPIPVLRRDHGKGDELGSHPCAGSVVYPLWIALFLLCGQSFDIPFRREAGHHMEEALCKNG